MRCVLTDVLEGSISTSLSFSALRASFSTNSITSSDVFNIRSPCTNTHSILLSKSDAVLCRCLASVHAWICLMSMLS